jgi:hypothetical protein
MIRPAYLSIALMGLFLFLSSCGGGGNVTIVASSGSVTVYVTDDISHFQNVTSTINKVQLVQTGTDTACDILTTPTTLNLTDLASLFELLGTAQCPAQSYNRIHIEFDRTVAVADNTGLTNTSCAFTSYKDQNNNPNVLSCSGDTCSLDINGVVNVLANKTNNVAMDFDLKNFDVSGLAGSDCSVTMKVSPLNASDINGKMKQGYKTGVTGTISGLDTAAGTFVISKGKGTFTVDYSAVTQTGLGSILQLAETDRLKVNVRAADIDVSSGTITASAIYVRVEGTVSGLDTVDHTFNLAYTPSGGSQKSIAIDYTNVVEVTGTLSDGATADAALAGFTESTCLAHQIEAGG